jgi:hypothetical protein
MTWEWVAFFGEVAAITIAFGYYDTKYKISSIPRGPFGTVRPKEGDTDA